MSSQQTRKNSGSRSDTASSAVTDVISKLRPAGGPTAGSDALRVLVIDDDAQRAQLVEEGLADDAVVHLANHVHGQALLDVIKRVRPDVIIVDCNSPDRDTLESLRSVARSNPKPIVMFVEEEGGDRLHDAIDAGVSAYVIDGLQPKRVRPLIDVAIARFKVVDGLRSELQRTKDDLAARKVIEKAKGLLMDKQNLTEAEAFAMLRDLSQQQGLPMKKVAENMIAILDMLNNAK